MRKRKKQIIKKKAAADRILPELRHVRDMIVELRAVKTWGVTQRFINSLYKSRIAKGQRLSSRQYAKLWECYDQWIGRHRSDQTRGDIDASVTY